MDAISGLKDTLEQALKEHSQLESRNKRLSAEAVQAQLKVNELNNKIDGLQKKRDSLEADLKEKHSSLLSAIEKRDKESERQALYVADEKKKVNVLKIGLEELVSANTKKEALLQQGTVALSKRLEKLEKAIEEARA